MAVYFLDSSAIAKRYVAEVGSAWVARLMDPSAANQLHAVRISGAEVMAAIIRRARSGNLTQQAGRDAVSQFRADFATLQDIIEVSPALIAAAMDLTEKHGLRGYDAVQLAAALAVQDTAAGLGFVATLVSADGELNAAARRRGCRWRIRIGIRRRNRMLRAYATKQRCESGVRRLPIKNYRPLRFA